MEILSNHLRENCDVRLPGLLSLSVKEAYRFLEELIEKEKILQRKEMKYTWGYLRNGLIDVAIKQVLKSSDIQYDIVDETSSKYSNGHTYLMIEAKGAIITPSKVYKRYGVPEKAIYRDKGSALNKQYNLFEDPIDVNSEYSENNPPFLLLTYGGADYKVEFISLGLPDVGVNKWIDSVDITNSPVILTNQKQVIDELQLTFTSEAEKIMGGVKDAGEEGSI